MGNIDAMRDWGHAKDYVRMQWMMLQQDEPHDFVIATGKQYSVREFIDWSAKALGITLEFKGSDIDEVGIVASIDGNMAPNLKIGQEIVRIDPRYFRPEISWVDAYNLLTNFKIRCHVTIYRGYNTNLINI